MESTREQSNVELPDKGADLVNEPPHYTRLSPQPIDVIDQWGLGFYPAQIIKYVARAGFKRADTLLEDLEKAQFYLNRWIEKVRKSV